MLIAKRYILQVYYSNSTMHYYLTWQEATSKIITINILTRHYQCISKAKEMQLA